jgi:non-ribosomal peptide synthetase component F
MNIERRRLAELIADLMRRRAQYLEAERAGNRELAERIASSTRTVEGYETPQGPPSAFATEYQQGAETAARLLGRAAPPMPAADIELRSAERVPVLDQAAYAEGEEWPHRAVVNTIQDINRRFEVGPEDRVLAVSGLEFDLAVYDVFGLLSPRALVLVEQGHNRDAKRLLNLSRNWKVTVWNSVPALLDMLLIAASLPKLLWGFYSTVYN